MAPAQRALAATGGGVTPAARVRWRPVAFPSADAVLRGRLYEHAGRRPRPAVVMAHGFSATITGMVADRYAEVLHAAGLNVLLFDHRGMGLSGGEPRLAINRWTQLRGYRDALGFASSLPSVDPGRLAVWGDSMSGATALGVAAFDERVRAVAVQVPACGTAPPGNAPGAFESLRDLYREGGPAGLPVETIGPMAVVSPDQGMAPSHLAPITAFRWFIDYGGRPGTRWQNRATVEIAATPFAFHAGLCAPHLRAASLWVVAPDDEMPGAEPDVARAAYRSAPGSKTLLPIAGGHFGLLYEDSETFARASNAEADFLSACL